ncbi:MAG TPA: hypoxanthine-guanine phosphoribosyltransferase [Gammaproteobacteria bacterium]|jgi:hypoxanthine phosphoribosyltransferase|nr:hypoxanthine-guanine phosphoribosyltransferase [Gammaproteobacteria bacterium]
MDLVKKFHSIIEQSECLYSLTEINEALDRMAKAITLDLQDKNPIIIAVMTGALITTGHLVTKLHFPLEIDYIHATRYRGAMRGGDLHWLVEPRQSLKGRTVLIVDDIMDGGLTLSAIIDYCQQAEAEAIHTAVLVSKNRVREPGVTFEPNYVGMTTEDRFLFGFGLDYEENLRNVPGIYAVKE